MRYTIRFFLGASILVRYGIILACQIGRVVDSDVVKICRFVLLALFPGFVQGVIGRFEGRDRGVAAGGSRARVDAGWVRLEGAVRTILDDAGDSTAWAVGSACTCGSS